MKRNQGWGRKFEVKEYGTSYDRCSLNWLGTFHNLPRIGWYFSSQFLYSPANHHLLPFGDAKVEATQEQLQVALNNHFQSTKIGGCTEEQNQKIADYEISNLDDSLQKGYTLEQKFTVDGQPWGIKVNSPSGYSSMHYVSAEHPKTENDLQMLNDKDRFEIREHSTKKGYVIVDNGSVGSDVFPTHEQAERHIHDILNVERIRGEAGAMPKIRVENAEELANVQCFGFYPHEIEKAY